MASEQRKLNLVTSTLAPSDIIDRGHRPVKYKGKAWMLKHLKLLGAARGY